MGVRENSRCYCFQSVELASQYMLECRNQGNNVNIVITDRSIQAGSFGGNELVSIVNTMHSQNCGPGWNYTPLFAVSMIDMPNESEFNVDGSYESFDAVVASPLTPADFSVLLQASCV